jgi:hypothetical protein
VGRLRYDCHECSVNGSYLGFQKFDMNGRLGSESVLLFSCFLLIFVLVFGRFTALACSLHSGHVSFILMI